MITQLVTSKIFKILLSATVISTTSSLAGKNPKLAGLIIALPIASMLALFFNYAEFKDPKVSVEFAKSIFYSIPLSLTFFIPFLFADSLKLPYWGIYVAGLFLLTASYLIWQLR